MIPSEPFWSIQFIVIKYTLNQMNLIPGIIPLPFNHHKWDADKEQNHYQQCLWYYNSAQLVEGKYCIATSTHVGSQVFT